MRRLLAVLGLTLGIPFGAARAEEDPVKAYDLHTWSAVWKAGDTATVKDDDSSTQVMDITQAGVDGKESTQKREQVQHDVSTYVVKCLEATEAGALRKSLVFLADWTHTGAATVDGKEEPSQPDTSLKGLHLEVTVKDGVHAYRILTPGAKPSEDGKDWLEKQFGGKQKAKWVLDLDHIGRPEGPVKAGDSWKGDPLKLDFPLPLDAKESTLKITLRSVVDGRMRLPVEMRFKVIGFPLGEGPDAPMAPFTEGGTLEGDGTITHSLAPHTFDCDATFMGNLKGTAAIKGMVKIVMDMGHLSELHATTGGEMPKPPEDKAAEKPDDAPK
jgi:hypothetical protein